MSRLAIPSPGAPPLSRDDSMASLDSPSRRWHSPSQIGLRAVLAVAIIGIVAIAAAVAGGKWPRRERSAARSDATRAAETEGRLGAVKTAAETPELRARKISEQSVTHEGIAVEFSVQHVDPAKFQANELQEGDDVRIRFQVADTTTGKPVRNLNPAAWVDLVRPEDIRTAKTCEQKVKGFLGGSIFGKAELDLNLYNVLTLNGEASISVVDPLFSFGGTKLLAMVVLESPGEDWTITANETRVYVSLPESKKIAVVDTGGWEVTRSIPLEHRPARIALQPDESLLWVADDTPDSSETPESGITALDTTTWKRGARITTGRGPHEVAFSDDGRLAFCTNGRDASVTIVDTRSLSKLATIATGSRPVSVAFSPLAKMAYVTCAGDGTITVIDGSRLDVVTQIKAEPGLGQIRFAPGGRLGFAVNPLKNVVYIIDAASNRIVQTADVEEEPYQVAFSDEMAYVRHRGNPDVLMMPLKAVGVENTRVQVFSFPGGQIAPAKAARLSPAAAIVPAPGENAVLVANPMDKAIYYYKEGMSAPMGHFSNYGREPRAVLVVDRSLRERSAAGVYETSVRLRKPGAYDVVFFLDSPRIVHCFTATVNPNPALEEKRRSGRIKITHLTQAQRVAVRENVALRFRLTDQQTNDRISGLSDVEVLTNLMPGTWHKRHVAKALDDGTYALDFVPLRTGVYYIYLQCLSRGLGFNNDQFLVLEAVEKNAKKSNN
jgi:YVTN family beta-propeller protein